MNTPKRAGARGAGGSNPPGFTLIELLTVIAVSAVLASLLFTSLASARRKSRTTVCTFNLHQICLAVDMYLDDLGKRPTVDALVANKYIASTKSFLCPEDKTRDWGRVVRGPGPVLVFSGSGVTPVTVVEGGPGDTNRVKYSYLLHPLEWDEHTWKRLMRLGGSAGIAACQLHGLGSQDIPDVHSFSGLLLRGQRDGAVVRRQFFWPSQSFDIASRSTDNSAGAVVTYSSNTSDAPQGLSMSYLYPLPLYIDDPATWLQTNP